VILFTKEIERKLQDQYKFGSELENQKVIAKIFNPYSRGVWYIINQDPNDPDYLWAIVDLFAVEVGSVSKKELESIRVPPFNLPLERDRGFSEMNALELYKGAVNGKRYGGGGVASEQALSESKNAELMEKMIVNEDEKRKKVNIKDWIRTGEIDGVRVDNVREASKLLKVSVSEIVPYIPR